MSTTTGHAQQIADDYVRAWTSRDVEKALSFLAEDVVCEAPSGRFEGLDRYRQFLEPFASSITGATIIGVLGDDSHAAAVYAVDTPFLKDFHGMEYLTVEDGKISHVISAFDRLPMYRAREEAQR